MKHLIGEGLRELSELLNNMKASKHVHKRAIACNKLRDQVHKWKTYFT